MFRRHWAAIGVALFAVCAALPQVISNPYYLHLLDVALVTAIAVLGLNFVVGYVGQISLGQAAFYGIGAYVSALVTMRLHAPFLLGLLAAMALSGLAGLVLGIPTLRLSGYYLAFATLGLSGAAEVVFNNLQTVTGGASGLLDIPPIAVGPWTLATDAQAYYFILACVLLAAGVALALERSAYGLAFAATKESAVAAEAVGIHAGRIKLLAFVVGSVYAGAAGSLYAHLVQYVSPDAFNLDESILMLTMVILGGPGSIVGVVFGSIFVTFLPELLRGLQNAYMVVYALGVLAVILTMPDGFAGLVRRLAHRLRARRGVAT